MNPYLSILSTRPPAGARYGEASGRGFASSRSSASASYGVLPAVVGLGMVTYAAGRLVLSAVAGAYQEVLNRAYNVDNALELELAVKEIEAAKAGMSLPSVSAANVPGKAVNVPVTLGDAKVKGAYWAALAARLAPGLGIEKIAEDELRSLSGSDYNIRDPRAVSDRLRAVEGQILRAATPAGRQPDPRVKAIVGPVEPGKTAILQLLSGQQNIQDAQARVTSPSDAAREMMTKTAPGTLVDAATQSVEEKVREATQSVEEKARETALQAAREWRKSKLPGFILDEQGDVEKWVLPTVGVTVVGAFLLARQRRRQELAMVASIARGR